jgi:hypothetical protein
MPKKLQIKHGWKWERMSEKIKWSLSLPFKDRYALALSTSEFVSKLYPKRRRNFLETYSTHPNIQVIKKK